MSRMSRPILTKKIKRNDVVYNLELWNPTFTRNSSGQFASPEQPEFRKDFFNSLDMSGTWPSTSKTKNYQDKFDEWFDSLSYDKKKIYAKAIDESNRIIISMVWDLIKPTDRSEYFNNNLRQFSNWFSTLEPTDVDFYMTRIMSRKSLIPSDLSPTENILSEDEIAKVLSQVYDQIDDDLIRATSINDLLCISCTDHERLHKAKLHMVRHGSILRDYRKKENAKGKIIYTYIFSKP